MGSSQSKENSPRDTTDNTDEKEVVEMNDMIKNFTEEVGKALKEKDEEIKRLTDILENLKKTFESVVIDDGNEDVEEDVEEEAPEGDDEEDVPEGDDEEEAEAGKDAVENNDAQGDSLPENGEVNENKTEEQPNRGGYRYDKRHKKRSYSIKKLKRGISPVNKSLKKK